MLLACLAACSAGTPSLPDPTAVVTNEIARAATHIAADVAAARAHHLGFDTSRYPGDDAMRAWFGPDSPYEWVGYYLPSPCHQNASWSGKRQTLTGMGWGLAVIYVGEQSWGAIPGTGHRRTVTRYVRRLEHLFEYSHGRRRIRSVTRRIAVRTREGPRAVPGGRCAPSLLTADRGASDAQDAVARARAEGFQPGTVLFLDIERMERIPAAMRAYYGAWTATVLRDGTFRPGVYAHAHNAEDIYRDVAGVYRAAGITSEPPFWIAGASGFAPWKPPADVGHAFAAVWQGILNVVETVNGVQLTIDKSVAAVPSPSAAEASAAE